MSWRGALPWLVLGIALVAATSPSWRGLVLGTRPTLEDLLSIRCLVP